MSDTARPVSAGDDALDKDETSASGVLPPANTVNRLQRLSQAVDGEFREEEEPKPGAGVVAMAPLESRREWTRAALAGGLVVLLAAVMLIIILTRSALEAKDLLGVVMAPLVGLVGAATGFYYGRQD